MTISQVELKALLHYDPESGRFTWLVSSSTRARAGSIAGCVKSNGYRYIGIRGHSYACHWLAWFYINGEWPSKLDHKDRDPLNNALSNLREATTSQNAMNMDATSGNTSGFRGVTWNRRARKWQAQSRLNGKNNYLGLFESAADAAKAYDSFCEANHGEFFIGKQGEAA